MDKSYLTAINVANPVIHMLIVPITIAICCSSSATNAGRNTKGAAPKTAGILTTYPLKKGNNSR